MGYYLFDSPSMGIILACILEFLALLAWLFVRHKFNKLYLLIGPGVMGLFILLDGLVETNREKLENTTRLIVQAAQEENPEAIISLLSDKFLYRNRLNKAKAAGYIESYLRRPVIVSNSIRELSVVQVTEQAGRVEFKVLTNFEPEGPYGMAPLLRTTWRFDFVRDSDRRYRVSNLEMLKMQDQAGIDIFSRQVIY